MTARWKPLTLEWQVKTGSFELLHASEEYERLIARGALIHRSGQQVARPFHLSGFICLEAPVQKLFRLALTLGNRLSCAIDVGTGTVVIPVQKDHARPDIDRLFVFATEVVVETRKEKFFDARRAFGGR